MPANQMTIPTDWNEQEDGYCLYLACVPNSLYWRAAFRGSVYALTRAWNWDFDTGIWLDIKEHTERVYDSLMACDAEEFMTKLDNIAKTNLLLMCALTGRNVQFNAVQDLQEFIDGAYFFENDGISNKLGPNPTLHGSEYTLSARLDQLIGKLDELKLAIEGQGPVGEDLEDDLANVWKQIEGVVEVLGKTPELPPTPL